MFSRNNVLVYNNIFYNNTLSIWHRGSNGRFYNNTIYNSPQFGIQVDSGNDIRNNIVYNASIAQTGSGNTLSNNLTTNPSFVNASAGDFHLQAGSPAIDAGVTVSEVTTDFDKRSRPQGARFAIGAYEYAGSAPRPLSAPTKRRVAGQ
jgi:hypothetical protein